MNLPTTRLVSLLAIMTIVWGHFISARKHEEIYVICAVSYWIRYISLLADFIGQYAMIPLAIGFGMPLAILSVILMGGALLTAIALSLRLIVTKYPSKGVLRAAGGAYYLLGLLIFFGLVLVIANRRLTNVEGPDKIFLSNFYFILPLLFTSFGMFYNSVSPKSASQRLS